jgi:hypothetical protein
VETQSAALELAVGRMYHCNKLMWQPETDICFSTGLVVDPCFTKRQCTISQFGYIEDTSGHTWKNVKIDITSASDIDSTPYRLPKWTVGFDRPSFEPESAQVECQSPGTRGIASVFSIPGDHTIGNDTFMLLIQKFVVDVEYFAVVRPRVALTAYIMVMPMQCRLTGRLKRNTRGYFRCSRALFASYPRKVNGKHCCKPPSRMGVNMNRRRVAPRYMP